ncbi:MAG: hypothetical protein NC331_03205 [Lachnospiraceae bacterium]|nr:hypothetical protein [Lachnospiraceae bacterium]MCM1238374.1 hypothetical protein [Lachnospiraceae bacterium]
MTDLGGSVVAVLLFAILVQFCVDRVKEILGEKVMNVFRPPVWAVAFGILFALMFNLDFFALLGFATSRPVLAKIITGLIMSSEATGVHELIAAIRSTRPEE